MNTELKIESLSQIANIAEDFSQLDDEYIFARITPRNLHSDVFTQSMRFDGITIFLCTGGSIDIDVNMHPHTMTAGTIMVATRSTVVNINAVDTDNLDAYVLILSSAFMRNVAIDLNALAASPRIFSTEGSDPLMKLTEAETSMMVRYFKLFHLNTTSNTTKIYVTAIARSLMAAIMYQLMQIASTRVPAEDETLQRPYSRKMNYVHDFMALVHKYYRQERSVGFYADKLFISHKYLSLIIKEATGRSAADWIDECVILEAKNLLRFSGKNVQQIAYELNFNNQSSFGKYFKHLTGMSPTQFQQS
ncbi:MAG: helix-turn-helix domain-containing protein [Muribaculaceae bacterium]|nr:helix-turn-helix domain-containing protein [Muribaculaceae bacterium]MDE6321618.1 helix-turn-helix domain-containing protein [Muribaculaceae bacterium]